MMIVALGLLFPLAKLVLYEFLDLPWFGFDMDLTLDIV